MNTLMVDDAITILKYTVANIEDGSISNERMRKCNTFHSVVVRVHSTNTVLYITLNNRHEVKIDLFNEIANPLFNCNYANFERQPYSREKLSIIRKLRDKIIKLIDDSLLPTAAKKDKEIHNMVSAMNKELEERESE